MGDVLQADIQGKMRALPGVDRDGRAGGAGPAVGPEPHVRRRAPAAGADVKLSAQEEYGLRCLLQMARRRREPDDRRAGRLEGISAANVAKILRVLRRGGFVNSTRGQAGGYTLARAARRDRRGRGAGGAGRPPLRPGLLRDARGMAPSCTHLRRLLDPLGLARGAGRRRRGAGPLTLQDLLRSEQEMAAFRTPNALSLPVITN